MPSPGSFPLPQATELGTVYTPKEIREITDFAHENRLIVHMDGARLANAAVRLNAELRELTTDVGIDLLSFGGTKKRHDVRRGRGLFSTPNSPKISNISGNRGCSWHPRCGLYQRSSRRCCQAACGGKNAAHANAMAKMLARLAEDVPGVRITRPVEANGVFAVIPREAIPILQADFFFYVWREETAEVRWDDLL